MNGSNIATYAAAELEDRKRSKKELGAAFAKTDIPESLPREGRQSLF